MRRAIAVLLVVAAVPATGASAKEPAGSETKSGGGVTAKLTWPAAQLGRTHATLTITRAGRRVRLSPERGCRPCVNERGLAAAAIDSVRDLDGDRVPEVVVSLWSNYAHCCSTVLIYRFRGGTWVRLAQRIGNAGYRLRDLEHDGKVEIVSGDDAFAYEFTSYADSWFPIRVWSLRGGKMADTTREHPAEIRADMAEIARTLPGARKDDRDRRGLAAAYAADLCLLDRGAEIDPWLAGLSRGDLGATGDDIWAGGTRFAPALHAFLAKRRYC